jgi:hypothetical protein
MKYITDYNELHSVKHSVESEIVIDVERHILLTVIQNDTG